MASYCKAITDYLNDQGEKVVMDNDIKVIELFAGRRSA